MQSIWNGLTRVASFATLAGCGLLFVAAFIVTVEVLIRKAIPDSGHFFGWVMSFFGVNMSASVKTFERWLDTKFAFSGSDEMSGYLFAVGTSWAMANVLITRGHVRIDALYGGFTPKLRAILDVFALLLLIVFIGALVERAFDVAWTNLIEYNRSNTNLRIPLAWSQIPWFAGILLFFITAVVALVMSVGALMRGDLAAVNAMIGASSQDEEIESELKGLGIEAPHVGKK